MNLADGVGLGLSLTLAVDSIVDTRVGVAVDSTIVTDSTIHSVVEVRLGLSLTLAVDSDSVDAMTSNLGVATNSGVHSGNTGVSVDSSHGGNSRVDGGNHSVDSSDSRNSSMSHSVDSRVNSGHHSVDSGNSVDSRNSSSHGGDHRVAVSAHNTIGVHIGLSLSISITLAIDTEMTIAVGVVSMSISSIVASIASIVVGISLGLTLAIDTIDATVANGSESTDRAMAIVHSSDDASMGEASVNLSDGVGICLSLSMSRGNSHQHKGKGSHVVVGLECPRPELVPMYSALIPC